MRSLNQIARTLSGRTRLEERAELASADTYTLIGVATTDSANGSVRIRLTDSVTRAGWDEEGTDIEVPTNGHVREGQRVYVTCFGGSMQEMVVSGAVGEGDELRADVNTALSEAEIARVTEGSLGVALVGDLRISCGTESHAPAIAVRIYQTMAGRSDNPIKLNSGSI